MDHDVWQLAVMLFKAHLWLVGILLAALVAGLVIGGVLR